MEDLKYPIFEGVNDEVIPPSELTGGSVGHLAQTFNNLVDFLKPRLIYGVDDFMGFDSFQNATNIYVLRLPVPLAAYFDDPTIEWDLLSQKEPADFNFNFEKDDLNLDPSLSPIFIGVTKGEKYSDEVSPAEFFQNIVTELTGSASYVELPQINYSGFTWLNPVVVVPNAPFSKIKINLQDTTKPEPGLVQSNFEFTSDTKSFS